MTNKKTSPDQQSFDSSFLEVFDQFVEELSELASRKTQCEPFYSFLLDRLRTVTSATSAAIWIQADQSWVLGNSKGSFGRSRKEIVTIIEESSRTEPEEQNVLVGKYQTPEQQSLAVSLTLASTSSGQLRRVYADLIAAVCDIAEDFHRNQSLNSQQQRFAKLESFIQLLGNSHSSLDPQAVGYHLTLSLIHI